MSSAAQIIFLTQVIIFAVIYTPCIIYFNIKFWKERDTKFIFQRQPNTVLVINGLLWVAIIALTLSDCHHLFGTFDVEAGVIRTLLTHFIFLADLFVLLRLWLLYYSFTHEMHLLDQQWTTHLDVHIEHWSEKYAKILGNPKRLVAIIIAFYITVMLIVLACQLQYGYDSLPTQTTLLTAYTVSHMCLVYPFLKIQSCRDIYRIRDEMRLILGILVASLVAYLIIMVSTTSAIADAHVVPFYILFVHSVLCLQLVMTFWVLREQVKFKKTMPGGNRSAQMHSDHSVDGYLGDPRNSFAARGSHIFKKLAGALNRKSTEDSELESTRIQTAAPRLEDVLQVEDAFRAFANHMVREFSVEHLLFVLQMLQLKHKMIQSNLIAAHRIGFNLRLAPEMLEFHSLSKHTTTPTLHQLVTGKYTNTARSRDTTDLKLPPNGPTKLQRSVSEIHRLSYEGSINAYHNLYERYVNPRSKHSINISGKCRKEISQAIQNYHAKLKEIDVEEKKREDELLKEREEDDDDDDDDCIVDISGTPQPGGIPDIPLNEDIQVSPHPIGGSPETDESSPKQHTFGDAIEAAADERDVEQTDTDADPSNPTGNVTENGGADEEDAVIDEDEAEGSVVVRDTDSTHDSYPDTDGRTSVVVHPDSVVATSVQITDTEVTLPPVGSKRRLRPKPVEGTLSPAKPYTVVVDMAHLEADPLTLTEVDDTKEDMPTDVSNIESNDVTTDTTANAPKPELEMIASNAVLIMDDDDSDESDDGNVRKHRKTASQASVTSPKKSGHRKLDSVLGTIAVAPESKHKQKLSGILGGAIMNVVSTEGITDRILLQKKHVAELITHFDKALKQVYQLLANDSFSRWLKTEEYENFVKTHLE